MDRECEICYTKYNNFLCFKYLKCGHSTCTQCYLNIIKTTKKCPFCRKKITEEQCSQSLPEPLIQQRTNIERREPLVDRNTFNIENTRQYRRMKKREKEIDKSEVWGKKGYRTSKDKKRKKPRYNQINEYYEIDEMLFDLEI